MKMGVIGGVLLLLLFLGSSVVYAEDPAGTGEEAPVDEITQQLNALDLENPDQLLKARHLVMQNLAKEKTGQEDRLNLESDDMYQRNRFSNSVDDWIRRTGGGFRPPEKKEEN